VKTPQQKLKRGNRHEVKGATVW